MTLSTSDFSKFHQAVHGHPPFEWQTRLLEQVVGQQRWPEVLDLPTGSGKTTCLDIALFALALDAENKSRWCPRRIAMVVDRRVVVDQVAERGRKLESALRTATVPVLVEVSRRLRSLSREAEALAVFTLRGGMPKDDGWVRSPDQPLILASTVDQLGSRLLMQGYGVSKSMAPVHAGLLGNDTLVLLDEVHLSEPFAETLRNLTALRGRFTELPHRFHCSFLSATPASGGGAPFRLTDEECTAGTFLGKRLRAKKPARLVEADDRQGVEAACLNEAKRLLTRHAVIAVVVNRVASAAVVARQLGEILKGRAEVVLLTGRMRPLDRDDVLAGLRPRIAAGRSRAGEIPKLVVVATQCIEAGADFDFDALVTEAASLSALRQRFGRVDRLGEYGGAEGVIIRDRSAKEDPIYGDALLETFTWLKDHLDKATKQIDFGPLLLPTPTEAERQHLLSPEKHAPVLLPAYLDLWAQTNPAPAMVPDVSLFLHGPQTGPADVQVVWRADVTEEDLRGDSERVTAIVSAVRPSSLEAISVPFVAAKRWLATHDVGDIADVEGAGVERSGAEEDGAQTRVFRWRGDRSDVVAVGKLVPGDTIVVPASRGGIREGCFDPERGTPPVKDLAERAALLGRGQALLRLHPGVLGSLGLSKLAEAEEGLSDELELSASDPELTAANPWMGPWLKSLAGGRTLAISDDVEWSFRLGARVAPRVLKQLLDLDATVEEGVELTTDEDDSSFAGRAVALREHSQDVQAFARSYASLLGLPAGLIEDLALAGWVHDIGKADRRFQILLRGGSEIDYYKDGELVLAKSGMPSGARSAHLRAQKLSRYPKGTRHEVQSLAMLERNAALISTKAQDLELVLHLVASHHGYCRPFAPPVEDPDPVDVTLAHGEWTLAATSSDNCLHQLDSAIAKRFWNLGARYGWLELCWLEAVLRLADHRASEMEQERGSA